MFFGINYKGPLNDLLRCFYIWFFLYILVINIGFYLLNFQLFFKSIFCGL
ncbi:hypothetical protein P20429_0651 [Pseudoalteromonas sp. BSi20429]|nr:hypothetical protein P20429_0651 [Pseudoalteromonas sp. BSi20429]